MNFVVRVGIVAPELERRIRLRDDRNVSAHPIGDDWRRIEVRIGWRLSSGQLCLDFSQLVVGELPVRELAGFEPLADIKRLNAFAVDVYECEKHPDSPVGVNVNDCRGRVILGIDQGKRRRHVRVETDSEIGK